MTDENKTEETGRFTQSKALHDIVNWSTDRPDWQRDALRQLVTGADVGELDLNRLEALCVGERDDSEFLNETDVIPMALMTDLLLPIPASLLM